MSVYCLYLYVYMYICVYQCLYICVLTVYVVILIYLLYVLLSCIITIVILSPKYPDDNNSRHYFNHSEKWFKVESTILCMFLYSIKDNSIYSIFASDIKNQLEHTPLIHCV